MANLALAPTLDTVYQIEYNDDVIGGAGMLANEQAQALGNRTEYLLQQFRIQNRVDLLPFLGAQWVQNGTDACSAIMTLEGNVQLSGVVISSSAVTPGAIHPILILPVSFRPITDKFFTCYTYDTIGHLFYTSYIQVGTTGEVYYSGATGSPGNPSAAGVIISLDQIQFINKP